MGDDGGNLAFEVSSPEKDDAGRGRAMHPGWWGFFGLLGVLLVVGLVGWVVQGMWVVFAAVGVGSLMLGAWGLWAARWRGVVLSDEVPSDPVVRAAAAARIREARGSGSERGWRDRALVMLVVAGVSGLGSVVAFGITLQAVMLMLLLVTSGLSAWVVCAGIWWMGRRLGLRRVPGLDADDAETVEDGGGDAEGREEARLLAWATARAVHRRAVVSSRNGMMLMAFLMLFLLGYSALLVAGGVGLPTGLVGVTGQFTGWLVGLPMLVLGGELLNHTDGARRGAVRASERLLYGEVVRVAQWRRGRDEMEALVRAHQKGRQD